MVAAGNTELATGWEGFHQPLSPSILTHTAKEAENRGWKRSKDQALCAGL